MRMRRALPAALLVALLAATTDAAAAPDAGEILAELNRARADPRVYAGELERHRRRFRGTVVHEPGDPVYRITKEGLPAVDEAIVALRRQPPLKPLAASAALALAASDHVRDQGGIGGHGHIGRDGTSPLDRAIRRGLRPWAIGEVISYGPETAAAVVRELIIDDGVPDRGHRLAIFNPDFGRAGAACGPHAGFRTMCVIDLASPTDAPVGARRVPD